MVFFLLYNRQLFSNCISPSPNSHLLDNARLEDRETEDQKKVESVKTAIGHIGREISARLKDMKPTQQAEMDNIVA